MNLTHMPTRCLFTALYFAAFFAATAAGLEPEYYVSVEGSDENPGTEALPFRTIGRACDEMSGVRAGRLLPPNGVIVWIRNGTYRETVRPGCIGRADAPIRFLAYPGEEPVVSGADILDLSWTLHAGKIYKARTTVEFEQLFVDGRMMLEARWPNTSSRDLVRPKTAECDRGTDDNVLVDNALPPGDWNGACVHINASDMWDYRTKEVRNYKPGQSLDFAEPGWFDYRRETRSGNPYWLFGSLAGLDRATEWFLDTQTHMLYLWCPGNPDPDTHVIEVKRRSHAFDLSGLSHIHLEGLRMFAAGINMDRSTHCTVVGCHLKYPVHRRILTPPKSWDIYFKDSNYMSGSHNEWKDCAIVCCSGAGIDDRGSYNKVTNCIIHDVDYTGGHGFPIQVSHGATGNQYTYNTIHDAGSSGIHGYIASALRIEHNHIYNCGTLTVENGLIWSGWSDGQGTVIAYNLAHDNLAEIRWHSLDEPGILGGDGIVLETDSRNHIVHHNLIWNIPRSSLPLMCPSLANHVYNNTILSGSRRTFSYCTTPEYTESQLGTRVINNIANGSMSFVAGPHAPEHHHNGSYAVDATGWPLPGSGAIDAAVVIPGITDGYVGAAPDIGCFEVGTDG